MAVSQNLRYLFGVGYHLTIAFFKGFLGVHQGTGVLTHCHMFYRICGTHGIREFSFFWGPGKLLNLRNAKAGIP